MFAFVHMQIIEYCLTAMYLILLKTKSGLTVPIVKNSMVPYASNEVGNDFSEQPSPVILNEKDEIAIRNEQVFSKLERDMVKIIHDIKNIDDMQVKSTYNAPIIRIPQKSLRRKRNVIIDKSSSTKTEMENEKGIKSVAEILNDHFGAPPSIDLQDPIYIGIFRFDAFNFFYFGHYYNFHEELTKPLVLVSNGREDQKSAILGHYKSKYSGELYISLFSLCDPYIVANKPLSGFKTILMPVNDINSTFIISDTATTPLKKCSNVSFYDLNQPVDVNNVDTNPVVGNNNQEISGNENWSLAEETTKADNVVPEEIFDVSNGNTGVCHHYYNPSLLDDGWIELSSQKTTDLLENDFSGHDHDSIAKGNFNMETAVNN